MSERRFKQGREIRNGEALRYFDSVAVCVVEYSSLRGSRHRRTGLRLVPTARAPNNPL